MKIYECDNCEDTERFEEDAEGFNCERGGHLFSLRFNNFEKDAEYHMCKICKNIYTEKCRTCCFDK